MGIPVRETEALNACAQSRGGKNADASRHAKYVHRVMVASIEEWQPLH